MEPPVTIPYTLTGKDRLFALPANLPPTFRY